MKKNNNKQNRILITVVVSCLALAALVSGVAMGFLHSVKMQTRQDIRDGQDSQSDTLQMQVEAVKAEEKLATGDSGNSGDGRKVIKIIEVVPDPSFSVFSYFVEWGSKEGYDQNTPIGYEGVREMALSLKDTAYSPFTILENAIKKNTLSLSDGEYDEVKANQWSDGEWERVTDGNPIRNVNGYFEYVGDKKGLYYIDLENIVEGSDTSGNYGIRYEISALERDGEDSKKGDWEVKDAMYYWAEDASTSYPTENIKNQTKKNYDLKFTYRTDSGNVSDDEYVYQPKTVTCNGGEYAAVANGTWTGSYQYQEDGNYVVDVVSSHNTTSVSSLSGYYVRVLDADKADGAAGLSAGYFRLYDSNKDQNVTMVYEVTYRYVGGSAGNYILNTSDVKQILNTGNNFYASLLFEYVGEDEDGNEVGDYDVTFIYAGSGSSYRCEIMRVTDGNGRYALTSSSENDLYQYVGNGQGDYSQLVTYIDCAGIDYTTDNWGNLVKGYYSENLSGMTMGCWESGGENGSWVFHTVPSDEINGYTMVSQDGNTLTSVSKDGEVYAVNTGSPKVGDRIYVYGQNRYYRYYAEDDFENNEWFKLLMYLSNEDGTAALAANDYAAGELTAQEIKEKYEEELAAFDKMYRIEVEQMTPGQLTADDVKEAALVYFSTQQCVYYNMYESRVGKWSENVASYSDDLSAEALLAIYKYCLYDETTALIYGTDPNNGGLRIMLEDNKTDRNLGKMDIMATLFSNPFYFSFFMEGYEFKNKDYSTVHSDATVTYYEQSNINGISSSLYNLGTTSIMDNSEIEPQTTSTWDIYYFRVIYPIFNGTYYSLSDTAEYDWQNSYNTYGGHFVNDNVNDDNTWYIVTSIFDIFPNEYTYEGRFSKLANIWKILHNRKSGETSEPVIIVTNADKDNISTISDIEPIYYFYVDPYSAIVTSDFDIDFKVLWTPDEVTEPTDLQSIVISGEEGEEIYSVQDPAYEEEYTCNVSNDFLNEGELNRTIKSKDYTITATDEEENSDSVIVRFIVREAFMLN